MVKDLALFQNGSLTIGEFGGLADKTTGEVINHFYQGSAEDFFIANGVMDEKSFFALYFKLQLSLETIQLRGFLIDGVRKGHCTWENLKTLYLMQNEAKRSYSQSLNLSDIWEIICIAQMKSESEDGVLALNYKGELLAIANQIHSISLGDLYYFFISWFYRDDDAHKYFSDDFMKYWYKRILEDNDVGLSRKLPARFILIYKLKYPEKDIFIEIEKLCKDLIYRDPKDHGVYRYIGILLEISDGQYLKLRVISLLWVRWINKFLDANNFYGGESPLGLLALELDQFFPKEEKQFVIDQVQKDFQEKSIQRDEFFDKLKVNSWSF